MNHSHHGSHYYDAFETKWTALGLFITLIILLSLYFACMYWEKKNKPSKMIDMQIVQDDIDT